MAGGSTIGDCKLAWYQFQVIHIPNHVILYMPGAMQH